MSSQQATAVEDLVGHTLARLGEKWTARLLRILARGPRRYSQLRRDLGIAPKVLTTVLRTLEGEGFVARFESLSTPAQVSYALTPLGQSLHGLVKTVESWATRNHELAGAPLPNSGRTDRGTARVASDGRDARLGPLKAVPSHVCIAVRDIGAAAKTFSLLFGVGRPSIGWGTVIEPSQSQGDIKQCAYQLSDFCIELIEPVSGSSPFRDFIRRFGQGIQHIGMRVGEDFEGRIGLLESRGVQRTLGGFDNQYAHFDFTQQFGSTLEIMHPDCDIGLSAAPGFESTDAFGKSSLSHIGIMVRDVTAAARQYVELLGVGASPVRTIKPAFPAGAKADSAASARIATIRHGGIVLVLLEPVGSSPWRDFLEERGSAVHHLAFNVHDRLDELTRVFDQQGGQRLLGRPGIGYAQFDFTSTLGLVVGLTGRSRASGRRHQPR